MFWKTVGVLGSILGAFGIYAGSVGGLDPAFQDVREVFSPIPPKIVSLRKSKKTGWVRAVARNDSRRTITILGVQGERTNPDYIVVTGIEGGPPTPPTAIQLVEQATADTGPEDICENDWIAKFDSPIQIVGRATGTVMIPVKGESRCLFKARLLTDRGFSEWMPLDTD